MALKINRRYKIYWGSVSEDEYDVVRLHKVTDSNSYFKFLYTNSLFEDTCWSYDRHTKIGVFSDTIDRDLGEAFELLD